MSSSELDTINVGFLKDSDYDALLYNPAIFYTNCEWSDEYHPNSSGEPEHIYNIDSEDVDSKLIIAANELYRAYSKNKNRKGLILAEGRRCCDIRLLRTSQRNYREESYYQRVPYWTAESKTLGRCMIWKDKAVITRETGNSNYTKV